MKFSNRFSIQAIKTDFPRDWTIIDIGWSSDEDEDTDEPVLYVRVVLFGIGLAFLYILQENEAGKHHWNNH